MADAESVGADETKPGLGRKIVEEGVPEARPGGAMAVDDGRAGRIAVLVPRQRPIVEKPVEIGCWAVGHIGVHQP